MAQPTLSEIISAIGDILTEEQKGELVTNLVDGRTTRVAPGDLITAGLFNQMLGDIADLAIRVSALEGAEGGPVITGIQPSTIPIQIGSLLTVLGSGFNPEPRFNTVTLGGKTITQFHDGSSEGALIFPVPDLFTGLPRMVTVSVETGGMVSNTYPVNLVAKPREQLGTIDVTEAVMPTGTLTANAAMSIGWDVEALTTLDDSLTLSLEVSAPQPAASGAKWQQAAAGGFTPASPMPINPGQKKRVTLNLTTPSDAVSANLQLKVVGIDGQVQALSPVIPWRAGQSLTPSSPNAEISIEEVNGDFLEITAMATTSSGTFPKGFNAKRLGTGEVTFQVLDKRTGALTANYACQATFAADGGDWDVTTLMGGTLNNVAPGNDGTLIFSFKNKAGAVGKEYLLRVQAQQTKSVAGITPYTSYKIYPIKLVN